MEIQDGQAGRQIGKVDTKASWVRLGPLYQILNLRILLRKTLRDFLEI